MLKKQHNTGQKYVQKNMFKDISLIIVSFMAAVLLLLIHYLLLLLLFVEVFLFVHYFVYFTVISLT